MKVRNVYIFLEKVTGKGEGICGLRVGLGEDFKPCWFPVT
jgi:hypothetical protein